jgi:hypothetical protein
VKGEDQSKYPLTLEMIVPQKTDKGTNTSTQGKQAFQNSREPKWGISCILKLRQPSFVHYEGR